jgi:hypothetical protein
MAARECRECSVTARRPTKLGVGWCANCVKARDSGVEVGGKRDKKTNPKYHVPDNIVAVFKKALSKVHKKDNTLASKSIASPSKLVKADGVHAHPVRLPASASPEHHAVRASTLPSKRDAAPNPKHPTQAARDAKVAAKMKVAAGTRDAAAANVSNPFALERLSDAQPFLDEMVLSASLAAVLESTAPPPPPVVPASDFDLDDSTVAPTHNQVVAKSNTNAASKSKAAAAKITVTRQVSTSGKTHNQLCVEVRARNKNLPMHLQLKNVKQTSVSDIDIFLQRQNDIIAAASIHAQCEGAKSRLTQQVQVTVCMRMLTLLAKKPELLQLYQESCAGSDRQQNDAGNKPTVNTGLGMGLNHAYYPALEKAFNDITFVDEFPFEYFTPTEHDLLPLDSTGLRRIPVPPKIINGFFAGMGMKECLIPDGFPTSFFDIERLSTIFAAGLGEYQNALGKFSVSGQHGKPLWFFCSPRKTIIPEEQHRYLDVVGKRWDTLAFSLVIEQVQELSLILKKAIPNGKGGVEDGESVIPCQPAPVGSSARVVAARERDNAEKRAGAADARSEQCMIMKKERHEQRMASYSSRNCETQNIHIDTLTSIKQFCDLKKYYEEAEDQEDMVEFCAQKIAILKESLKEKSTTSTATNSTPSFNTPAPRTPSNGALSPITPLVLL